MHEKQMQFSPMEKISFVPDLSSPQNPQAAPFLMVILIGDCLLYRGRMLFSAAIVSSLLLRRGGVALVLRGAYFLNKIKMIAAKLTVVRRIAAPAMQAMN